MYRVQQPILHIPESVKQDTLAYRGQVEKFLRGQTSPVAFRAYRVPMGVYEQRTDGKYMVRVRIGAGLVLPYQLERIAQLSKTYGNGVVHITTRQDIQIHQVEIEDTPDVLEGLLEVGLSSRGGGGNTVRNVTACPRAGVCPKEEFDVAPYAICAAEYLLQFTSSYNLPRKYKIAFSGCSDDCAFASVADLGFFAHPKERIKGFSVYAGGGLGPNPAVAVKVEEFVTDSEFLEVAEAIKRIFDKYGDRSNKHKARLRYVVARLGAQEFVKLYKTERENLHGQRLKDHIPAIKDIASNFKIPELSLDSKNNQILSNNYILPEKTHGLFTIKLTLNLGDIFADDLIRVGRVAEEFGRGLVRTTQSQDLLITGVSRHNIEKTKSALEELSANVIDDERPKIVTCTGAATCKLGLCLSRGLSDAISEKLIENNIHQSDTTIKISGCPNSCGHHYVADIGFEGRAKRVNGKLMPCYDVLAGARTIEGSTCLAERLGVVPAKRIPQMLAEAFKTNAIDKQRLKNLVQEYGDFTSMRIPEDYYYDFGSEQPFSLAGRGPGECGAGVMDVIKLDIEEAKDGIQITKNVSEKAQKSKHLYEALVATTRALLIIFGQEPKKDREIFAAFSKLLIEPGWIKPQAQQLLEDAIDWRMGERDSIDDLAPQVDDLAKRVKELFLSLDADLKFKAELITQKTTPARQTYGGPAATEGKTATNNRVIDLRGVECPLNFVKAKLELEKINVGQILEILLDEGEPVRNVPTSFAEQGQQVIEIQSKGGHCCVKVRRKK